EPLVELASDLPLDADQLEAARRMKGPTGLACSIDAGKHGVEPGQPGDVEQIGHNQLADATPLVFGVHVHRVLDTRPVRSALSIWRERAEDHDRVAVDGNEP